MHGLLLAASMQSVLPAKCEGESFDSIQRLSRITNGSRPLHGVPILVKVGHDRGSKWKHSFTQIGQYRDS